MCEIINITQNLTKREGLRLIFEILRKDDPEEKRLGAIINKKENVPRKYLLLLFSMRRGEYGSYKSAITALNKLLDKCGMHRLYSRNQYDWLIMNSFYATAKNDGDVIVRMRKIAKIMIEMDETENE